jgi:hypothetical protein
LPAETGYAEHFVRPKLYQRSLWQGNRSVTILIASDSYGSAVTDGSREAVVRGTPAAERPVSAAMLSDTPEGRLTGKAE